MATQQAEKAAVAAVQTGSAYWRAAGMTYIWFACRCAVVVRSCLKEPFKSQALSREKVHYRFGKYNDGKQGKSEYRGVVQCTPIEK
ncbi:ATP synthase subunit epsilon, mitochondrial [Physcomitrium patens]|uniref:ATP synthase subunit epsilon, mitochondrial n=1 Tax=Physcomitrium patens TaxID=3218 RepID=UPI00024ADD97|nr:ATP synthase subunit epsilon, mitochondrial-like [Physcomitrium patens]|eukprot:XP_024388242.1 ATP synthase subunit epsilon, mitochondrial-like [Physcomitrella patens]